TCLSLFLLRCVLLRPLSSFPTRRSSDLSRAALIPVRSEHEMVDQQLAAPIEQIGKAFPPRRRIEHVILVDLHPRQGLPLSINLVAQMRGFFLACQKRAPRVQPDFSGYDLIHGASPPPAFAPARRLQSSCLTIYIDININKPCQIATMYHLQQRFWFEIPAFACMFSAPPAPSPAALTMPCVQWG